MRPIRKPSVVARPLIGAVDARVEDEHPQPAAPPGRQGADVGGELAGPRAEPRLGGPGGRGLEHLARGLVPRRRRRCVRDLEQVLEDLGGEVVEQDVGRRDVREGRLELVGAPPPRPAVQPAVRWASRTTVVNRSVASPVSSTTSSAVRSARVPERLGAEEPGLGLLAGQAEHGAGRRAGADARRPRTARRAGACGARGPCRAAAPTTGRRTRRAGRR